MTSLSFKKDKYRLTASSYSNTLFSSELTERKQLKTACSETEITAIEKMAVSLNLSTTNLVRRALTQVYGLELPDRNHGGARVVKSSTKTQKGK